MRQEPQRSAEMRTFLNSRLVVLVALFLALCLAYNVAVPLFEAPDERDHVDFADWLAAGKGLPHLVNDREEVGEIWQPPLYYALVALFIAPIDRSDLETIAPLSADWQAGLSRSAHYHTAAEAFPYRGAALATHTARAVSTVLGLVTVLATYAIARRLIPRQAMVAAALVALNPQFIFMSAAVNNDNLVIMLCSVALWILVKMVTDLNEPQWGWYVTLGLVWGLAGLAKLTGLTLGLVIGLTLVYLAYRRRSWRPLLVGGMLAGGTMLLVCGWWFWRNWQLYGDPLAWSEMLAVTGALVRPEQLSWPETLRYATFLRKTYWGIFGYGILAPDSFYVTVTIIMIVIGLGWLVWVRRAVHNTHSPERFAVWILAIWCLTVLLFLLRWMRQIDATNQGRLLFPAIAALSVLAAAGIAAFDGKRMLTSKVIVTLLGCWAAALPLLTIVPAFAQPRPVIMASVPNPADIRFGDAIQLLGYDLPPSVEVGQPVEVGLYWMATHPLAESYVVALRVMDAAGRLVTGIDTLPAGGRYPTVVWEPGSTFRDTYTLPPLSSDDVPGLGSLLVILYPRGEPGTPLAVTLNGDPAGNEARFGAIKLAPNSPDEAVPSRPSGIVFNDQFRLIGYDIPDITSPGYTTLLTLYWEAHAPDGRDYTVFAHLLDESGELVAQFDSPPRAGTYPTSIWEAGERVVDEHIIIPPFGTPAGFYTLLVGLYDPVTGTRLPAYGPDGTRQSNDALRITDVQVVPPGTGE